MTELFVVFAIVVFEKAFIAPVDRIVQNQSPVFWKRNINPSACKQHEKVCRNTITLKHKYMVAYLQYIVRIYLKIKLTLAVILQYVR